MKRLSIIASIAALALGMVSCQGQKAAPEVKPLTVKGTQLYAGDEPVTFKGISFGWNNIWPRFYNAGAVKELNEVWGSKIFRAAIAADDIASADNPGIHEGYITDPEFARETLCSVIDAAIAQGAYVIVDWHSHILYKDAAVRFFTEVASKYSGVPNVIYELFNEPVCWSFEDGRENPYEDLGNPDAMAQYWTALKDYADACIKAITSVTSNKPLILMGCPSWDQRIDLPVSDPVTSYDNLMYTVHFYAATHKQSLRDATAAAYEAGLPIFISECAACEASGDGYLDEEEWKLWDEFCTERNISMMTWSISDKVETCSMFIKEASSEGPWADDVIKPWGKIVKDWAK